MKPSPRSELAAAIAAAPKRTVQIGNKLHVHIGSETFAQLDVLIAAGLRRGDTVTENGEAAWIVEEPVYDRTKSGSAAYTWKGDKVKVTRTLCRRKADGSMEQAEAGFVWRALT